MVAAAVILANLASVLFLLICHACFLQSGNAHTVVTSCGLLELHLLCIPNRLLNCCFVACLQEGIDVISDVIQHIETYDVTTRTALTSKPLAVLLLRNLLAGGH
jgi:hypothetical protein